MAENEDQERTEAATARRQEQARNKGQVPRSRELASVVVMVIGAVSLLFLGEALAKATFDIMQNFFHLSRKEVFDVTSLAAKVYHAISSLFFPLFIILILLFIASFFGAFGVGGIAFSWQAARPQFAKLNPIQGLKRMLGKQSAIELIKSILKIALILSVAAFLVGANIHDLYQLSIDTYPVNFYHALNLLLDFILWICCSLFVVVAIDVPFQIWQHNQQLKMTKQEIKDEFKEIEGRPEVKGRIRMLQREMAQRRMMANIPTADVIIANPEHYCVALRYNSNTDKAPIVVAKGSDFIAFKIREIARKHGVSIVTAPPLARALYHSTELEQQIPDGLFMSVAQILAYVFQLKQYQNGRGRKPAPIIVDELPIPSELQY